MATGSLYTYGVIEEESLSLSIDAVSGAEQVYTIDQPPFAAIVSELDDMDVPESEENIRAHSEVLNTVLSYDGGRTVVPMQFGMVFAGPGQVRNVLRGSRPAFTRALRFVDGAVELGIKVIGETDADVDVPEIEETAEATFSPLSKSVAENTLFSDRLLLNRAYLVDRSDRKAFDEAVRSFDDTVPDATVQYTGPWAPYNFVDITIGAER